MSKPQRDQYLDAGMMGWIVNTANKEYWRVAQLCDLADLIQDGYLCYAKCVKAYPELFQAKTPTKHQRREFQALVKVAFANHISTLAAKHKGVNEYAVSSCVAELQSTEEFLDRNLDPVWAEGSLLMLLAAAPAELLQLVQVLAADSLGVLAYARRKVGRRSLRETNNDYYCRLVGADPQRINLASMVRDYFG